MTPRMMFCAILMVIAARLAAGWVVENVGRVAPVLGVTWLVVGFALMAWGVMDRRGR
jgi:hypothetical protein